MSKTFFCALALCLACRAAAASPPDATSFAWADSVLRTLTPAERIGQLFMVAAYSNRDEAHYRTVERLVRDYGIGGLIFFQGGPTRQARLTNRYQAAAKVPLLISMDAEWGLGMRLDSVPDYPRQMTLGAIADNAIVYEMGAQIAAECRRLGVHVNFAPVVDVNSNPRNPVIGTRSFGENKVRVAEKGVAYMQGLQQNGVMANAKHFPGHGDTESDSHLTLPVVRHGKDRLSDVELYPFRRLIADSLMSMMVAHLHVPTYDDRKNMATTLSKTVVTDLLQKELGFEGLIFTDALNMKGVSQFYPPGEVDVLALLAGNDVLLFAEDVPTALKKIQAAVIEGRITQKEIDRRARKVLAAKHWAGLPNFTPVATEGLHADLSSPTARALIQRLYERALTIAKNDRGFLPIHVLDTARFASVTLGLGPGAGNTFQQTLSRYASFDHFQAYGKAPRYQDVAAKLRNHDVVVVGVHGMSNSRARSYGVDPNAVKFLQQLEARGKTVVTVVFGNPYSLKYFEGLGHVVCAYQDNDYTRRAAPQLLFGAIGGSGTLPVTASEAFKEGAGFFTKKLGRLRYGAPEDVGLDSDVLRRIDTIARRAILDGATPGCQVLVARHGTVVKEGYYGFLTYNKQRPVSAETVYDVASITKVAATLQAVMFLTERGLIDVNQRVAHYLPELKDTPHDDIVVADVLTHQAGLVPFIPHWRRTMKRGKPDPKYYRRRRSRQFPHEVAPGLYAIAGIEDSLWRWSLEAERLPVDRRTGRHGYRYSDLSFYMLKRMAERQLQRPIEAFLDDFFYQPLGLPTFGFNPRRRLSASRIAPTERDRYFRQQQVRGNVHDQGAAMLGGVGGHAGLFGTANELAVLMQMNLQGGYYGGTTYLQPQTVEDFAQKAFPDNRRGLGWDKPTVGGGPSPTARQVSSQAFGHSGFTGTCVWADPAYGLVYVFLSNRIYPDATNKKLIRNNVRTDIQATIYQAMKAAYPIGPAARLSEQRRAGLIE